MLKGEDVSVGVIDIGTYRTGQPRISVNGDWIITAALPPIKPPITLIDSGKVQSVELVGGTSDTYLVRFVPASSDYGMEFTLYMELINSHDPDNPINITINIEQSAQKKPVESGSIQDSIGQTSSLANVGDEITLVPVGNDVSGAYVDAEDLTIWWQTSIDNENWVLCGTNKDEYTITVSEDTYVRRCVSDGADIAYSNTYFVRAELPSIDGGEIRADKIEKYGSERYVINNIREASFDDLEPITYVWEKSDDEINWDQVSESSLPYYSPIPTSKTTYYRRKAKHSRYETYSNIVEINPCVLSGGIVGLQKDSGGGYCISNLSYPDWCPIPDEVVWEELVDGVCVGSVIGEKLYLSSDSNMWADSYRRKITYNGCSGYSNEIHPFLYDNGNVVLSQKTNDNGVYTSIAYYDGLGRLSQTVDPFGAVKNEFGEYKDLVSPIVYDDMGRDNAVVYLPFADGSSIRGSERREFEQVQSDYYKTLYGNGGEFAYKKTEFESSPIDRIGSVRNVGSEFADNQKNITYQYQTNDAGEVYLLVYNDNRSIKVDGYYTKSSLTKTVTVNEDGSTSIIYRDFLSNVILSRQVNGYEHIDTYYVYDNCNRLCVVVPPTESEKLSSCDLSQETFLDIAANKCDAGLQCYYYAYDGVGNCIEEQIPGAEPVYYIYNITDKVFTDYPVAMQDGNLRENNTWLLMDYDGFRRLIRTSYISLTESSAIDVSKHIFDSKQDFLDYFDSYKSKYKYVSEKSYDKYWMSDVERFMPVENIVSECDVDDRVKGFVTSEKSYLLDSNTPDTYLSRSYYYDKYGRTVQIVDKYPSGAVARYSMKYDMLGNILAKHESHTHDGVMDYIVTHNELDHRGRLLSESTYASNSTCPILSTYTYDDFGTLQSKVTNGIDEQLTYNIQGWLTSKTVNISDDALFNERLKYFETSHPDGVPCYSGNIAEMSIYPNSGKQEVCNLYYYDLLSRLKRTKQYIDDEHKQCFVDDDLSYDKNGNILGMLRYDSSDDVNYLQYSYANGRLKIINDSRLSTSLMPLNRVIGGGIIDFPRDSTIIITPITPTVPSPTLYKDDIAVYDGKEYVYDSNGNVIYDGYHGLNIRYNHLNLPRKISRGDDILVNYVYLADGSKYSALKSDGSGFIYEGSFIYSKDADGSLRLESIPFNGGRLVANSNGDLLPRYFITDHLGSVRGVLNENLELEEQNDYYQFGKHVDDPNSQISENRYRYNGKENLEFFDIPYLDYGARLYDPHIGRWLQQDPLAEKYYPVTPYAYCANNPVKYIDPDGRKLLFAPGVSDDFKTKFAETIKFMNARGTSGDIAKLHASETIYYIGQSASLEGTYFSPKTNTIYWNPDILMRTNNNILMSPATILAHEADHAQMFDYVNNSKNNSIIKQYNESVKQNSDGQYFKGEERRVITGKEQSAAQKHGEIREDQITRTDSEGVYEKINISNMTPEETSNYIYEYNNQYIR